MLVAERHRLDKDDAGAGPVRTPRVDQTEPQERRRQQRRAKQSQPGNRVAPWAENLCHQRLLLASAAASVFHWDRAARSWLNRSAARRGGSVRQGRGGLFGLAGLDPGGLLLAALLLDRHLDLVALLEILELALLAVAGDPGVGRHVVRVLVLAGVVGHGQPACR